MIAWLIQTAQIEKKKVSIDQFLESFIKFFYWTILTSK